jgi:hypothetical protein
LVALLMLMLLLLLLLLLLLCLFLAATLHAVACTATQVRVSFLKSNITPSNVADLLLLAVNRPTRSWTTAAHLLQWVRDMLADSDSRGELWRALQQPGLQESLLRTALQHGEWRADVMPRLCALPGMACLPAAAAVSLFKEVLNEGKEEVFNGLCFTPLAVYLDAQWLLEILQVVLQRDKCAGLLHALLQNFVASPLELGQVSSAAAVEGVTDA